jgi:TPP-dependent pyruvate/acetoin dehydrogenase alpha subunit
MTAAELIAFEKEVADAFNSGKIRAPIHLSGGNEEQLIEYFSTSVLEHDWVCSSWRSHYHCLLKGVPPDMLMRDILDGKSITLNYPAYRILSSAIVGGSLSWGVGIALSLKRKKAGTARVHAFCGDMTARGPDYHVCIQYAAGHELPIRFIVERNGVSVCTDTDDAWGHGSFSRSKYTHQYTYVLPWPHSGAGHRVEF